MRKRFLLTLLLISIIAVLPFVSAPTAHSAKKDEISDFAQQFTGTPYLFGGTTPSGFDCSGFITYVFDKFGINLPRTSETQFAVGKEVSESELQPGDLVFFNNTYKEGISHAGIYLGNNQFISAETKGVAVAKLFSHPYWGPRYAGAKRVTGDAVTSEPINVFTDLTKSHPAYTAILNLNSKGVINGYLDSTFKPEQSITRGQAAAMLNRVLKLSAENEVIFTDVGKDNKFAADIAAMNEVGILQGYPTGEFGINGQLTRGQLALIVDRAFNLQEKAQKKVQIASLYSDVPSTYWASNSIHALKIIDQTTIFQTHAYEINKEVTRAEFSAAVFSAVKAQ
jgi:hypothetical protein